MAQFRPQTARADRGRAARDLGDALASPRISTQIRDLVRDVGGTRAAAALVGRSERTVQRWSAGQVGHVPDQLRSTLARAGGAARTRNLIGELGGTRRVAELTGRSLRTVQRWANGQIAVPRADARQLLGRADAAVRMRGRGLTIDPATGRPRAPIYLTLKGNIRVNASRSAGYSYDSRSIGTGGMSDKGYQLDDAVIAEIVDALGQGDYRGAQAALEEHLSSSYVAVGSYDPATNIGLFIDSIESVEFNQDDIETPESPV